MSPKKRGERRRQRGEEEEEEEEEPVREHPTHLSTEKSRGSKSLFKTSLSAFPNSYSLSSNDENFKKREKEGRGRKIRGGGGGR